MLNRAADKFFFFFLLPLHLAVPALIYLGISPLRQIICFLYLAFVPGTLIIRLIKLNFQGAKRVLCSLGLSTSFLLITGFLINMAGIAGGRPESFWQAVVPVIYLATFLASIILYYRERRDDSPEEGCFSLAAYFRGLKVRDLNQLLFLTLLPVISALGASAVNIYKENRVLLFLIAIIAVTVMLIMLDRLVEAKYHRYAIVMIAIALLWHWSLITPYLVGGDVHAEFYFFKLVTQSGYWNYHISNDYNAMLSITVLPAIYSIFTGLDPLWVFKLAYPVIYSFVPLALYEIYLCQVSKKESFLSVFLFMSMVVFFSIMPALCRQQIAELFLVLFLMLLLDIKAGGFHRALLIVVFVVSMVASHYSLTYIFCFCCVFSAAAAWIEKRIPTAVPLKMLKKIRREWEESLSCRGNPAHGFLTANFITLLLVLTITWYLFISSGSIFYHVLRVGDHIYASLKDIFEIESRNPYVLQALGLSKTHGGEISWKIARYVQYVTQFFIVTGFLNTLKNIKDSSFNRTYIFMSMSVFLVLGFCVVIPQFSETLNIDRFYHIALFFLSPFCILGGKKIINIISGLMGKKISPLKRDRVLPGILACLVIAPYFLFQSGFVFEVTGSTPTSVALNQELDYHRFKTQEILGKNWLSPRINGDSKIYADIYGDRLLYEDLWGRVWRMWGDTERVPGGSYIFLRDINVNPQKIRKNEKDLYTYVDISQSSLYKNILAKGDLVYSNGACQVYVSKKGG
ncbi:MAG: hypothetical protein JL50_20925 [Peptococcaceae bacterium BICA1-7]|nr:MAG: hypothetical protein JL50_20925 [Peptococcaceae bacterium BICA1-7]HBV98547.1 DUF2206 domain-containing protein [Desulfotomaculum sp.]